VPVGKRVRLGVALNKVKDAPGGVQGTFELTFELESASKQACVAEVAYLIISATPSPAR
jgi:hypothetical protein